jgi:hypothetical protein
MTLIKLLELINGKINTDKIIQGIISSIIEINSNKSWRMRIQIKDDNPILEKTFYKNLLIEYFWYLYYFIN